MAVSDGMGAGARTRGVLEATVNRAREALPARRLPSAKQDAVAEKRT